MILRQRLLRMKRSGTRRGELLLRALGTLALATGITACSGGREASKADAPAAQANPAPDATARPGMPPEIDPNDIYGADRQGQVNPFIAH